MEQLQKLSKSRAQQDGFEQSDAKSTVSELTRSALSVDLSTESTSTHSSSDVTTNAAPSNDNFAESIEITGSSVSVTGNNIAATGEAGEPNHASVSEPLNSVWWNWTAPENGVAIIDTFGSSNPDTTLGIYTGSAVDSLTEVASNNVQGQVGFTATAGTTYHIAVDGYFDSVGEITLNLDLLEPAANDNFADSIEITGSSVSVTGINFGATGETGEPDHASDSEPLNSVWWSWTAPENGFFMVDTAGSNYDTTLGVYTGSAVDSLTEIASNDDLFGVQSQAIFSATAGTTYHIAVDGSSGSIGEISLNIDESQVTFGDDNIVGTAENDTIDALAGNDTVAGGGGNDWIYGSEGDDLLKGQNGFDILYGEEGNDTLLGGNTRDILYAAVGDDLLEGGNGDDELLGQGGNDTLRGGNGNDNLFGDLDFDDPSRTGDDLLEGNNGDDFLDGAEGNDTLLGGKGSDFVFGDAGDDLLKGNDGSDNITGGEGNDTLLGGKGPDLMLASAGDDLLKGGDGDDYLSGLDGNDSLQGGNGADELYGDAGNDLLKGNDGDDFLSGSIGNDILRGQAGNDKLMGRQGYDQLFGGKGNDTLAGTDAGGDRERDLLTGGAGFDTFVLGDGLSIYYDNNASSISASKASRAIITDFVIGEDMIQLSDFGSYELFETINGSTQIAEVSDTVPEVIATVIGVTGLDLEDGSQFELISNFE